MDEFEIKQFGDCNLNDSFFDSLKEDYQDFTAWHSAHKTRKVYVCQSNKKIYALLILKDGENEQIPLQNKTLPQKARIKICTLKVDSDMRSHGLGEKMLNIALNHFIKRPEQEIYITVFPKYNDVVQLLKKNGFEKVGKKQNGEDVFVLSKRDLNKSSLNNKKTNCQLSAKESKTILLSINPQFVKSILAGTKQYEYRTKIAKQKVDTIIIYCTSPTKMVLAQANVKGVLCGTPSEIWEKTKTHSGTSKAFYDKYFENKKIAYAYRLGEIKKYKKPLPLKDFGLSTPPQSFVYIETK